MRSCTLYSSQTTLCNISVVATHEVSVGVDYATSEWLYNSSRQVFTVEEMMPHLTHVKGAVSKNLFLKDKKKKLWLLSAKHDAEVKLADVAKKV